MEFKKGDEFKVRFSTTKFDYDDDGNVTGFEDNRKFGMDLWISDKENNLIYAPTALTEWDLDIAENLDFEEEMKSWVEEFAKENNIEKYSLKDVKVDYGENQVKATLVID